MTEGIFGRIAALYKVFILMALCIIGKIIYMQFINPTEIKASDISYRAEVVEAIRGDILASDGRPLATSIPYYKVRIDCTVPNKDTFKRNVDALSKQLASFFKDKTASQYKQELIYARKNGKRYKALGNRLVDYSELAEIKKFSILRLGANKGGLITEEKYKRNNPYGRLAYRTIGFINTEGVGVGIEGSWDYYLKGTPGQQIVQRMLGGEWRPINSDETILPKDGYDIQTTIDIDIQEAAEKALKEQLAKGDNIEGATAIVMEVSTGAIKAIANMKKDGKGGYDESYNYAIGEATEPGSVFKLITLVSLLEDGHVTLESPIDAGNGKWNYGGHTYSDVTRGGYGLVNVKKAFEKSSNVAFAKLAVEHYSNNEKKYVDRIQSMKVGERFNLDIQGEARAAIYAPGDLMWSRSSLSSMAIGYATLLTPLHTLTFYNAIANGGKMMKPFFISNYQLNGQLVKEFTPIELSGSICSKKTVEMAKEALRGVVEEGTGKSLNNPNYMVSGKTGTARMSYGGKFGYEKNGFRRYQASFAGFFPSDKPKYSAIVILYSGDTRGNFYGGSQAGPVFKQIADHIYATSKDWSKAVSGKDVSIENLQGKQALPMISCGNANADSKAISVLPVKGSRELIGKLAKTDWASFKADSTKLEVYAHPIIVDSLVSVINMGIKDAIYLLENQGYKVKFKGYGRVVKQDPVSGSKVARNSIINLELEGNETN